MSEEETKRPLSYQVAPSAVTRGQFRLLLLLMLIQVMISAQSAYAPGFMAWVRDRWAEHQKAVAHQAQVRKTEAIAEHCLSYTQPPTKVIWEWEPVRAAKLLAGPGYQPVGLGRPEEQQFQNRDAIRNAVPFSAMADEPIRVPVDDSFSLPTDVKEFLTATSGPVASVLEYAAIAFLHGRRASDGSKRLVMVLYHATSDSLGELPSDANRDSHGTLHENQSFTATAFSPGEDGVFSAIRAQCTDLSVEPSNRLPVHWVPSSGAGQPGKLTIDYRDQLRVFAGQPDSADESHFTIGYELNGKPGTIDGWLMPNGSVVLEPREGKRVNAKWYPQAK